MKVLGVAVHPRPSFVLLGVLAAISVAHGLRVDLTRPASLGVPAGIGPSTAVVVALSVAVAALLLLSVALHELAHAVAGSRLGLGISRIELTAIGGMTHLDEPETARAQFQVSIVGPLVNLFLGGVAAAVWVNAPAHGVVAELAIRVASLNALLAVFNLLPGLPLDGGQVLRAAAWRITGNKVTGLRVAAYGGLLTAGLTFAIALNSLREGAEFGLITLLIAFFMGSQAQLALRGSQLATRLPEVIAGVLARPAYLVNSDLPLAEALRRAADAGRSAVVFGTDDQPSAVLSDTLLAAVPDRRRPWVSLSSVARVVRPAVYIDAALSGEDLLEALRADPAPEHVVMDHGHLVGVLRNVDVAAQLSGQQAPG